MTLQQLKYVSMVERCGSFSKAAQKLYVSQPSVSNLVHGLEEELHITIFQRTPSGVVITNEGRELLKLGNKLLRDADYIDEYFHAGGEGRRPSLFVSSQHYDFVVAAFEDFGPRRRMTGIPWDSTRTRRPWSSTMCGGSTAIWGCCFCRT